MDRREDSRDLLGRLDNMRDAIEEALGHARGSRTTTGVDCSKPISGASCAR
jgi:hypothetical protein